MNTMKANGCDRCVVWIHTVLVWVLFQQVRNVTSQDFGFLRGTLPSSFCNILSNGLLFRGSSEINAQYYPSAQGYIDAPRGWLSNVFIDGAPLQPFLEIDLGTERTIYGIITRGRQDWANDYPQKYRVQYCFNDATKGCASGNWAYYGKVFDGNTDNTGKVTNVFDYFGITTRTVRIRATQWIDGAAVAMRAGVVTCSGVSIPASTYAGQFGSFTNGGVLPHSSACSSLTSQAAFKSSTEDLPVYTASDGFLDNYVSWMARNYANSFLTIDLRRDTMIFGIITQGRPDWDDWVTSYEVEYCVEEVAFCESPFVKWMQLGGVYMANNDRNTKVTNIIAWHGIPARVIRIKPKTFRGAPAMRVGFVTCYDVNVPANVFVAEADCNTKGEAIACPDRTLCFLRCNVENSCVADGPPLWGDYSYTIDSPICRAAWHIGGESFVRTRALMFYYNKQATLNTFLNATRHGITSLAFNVDYAWMSFFPQEMGLPALK